MGGNQEKIFAFEKKIRDFPPILFSINALRLISLSVMCLVLDKFWFLWGVDGVELCQFTCLTCSLTNEKSLDVY